MAIKRDIWENRNNIIFRNAVTTETFAIAQLKSWVWITKKAKFSSLDWCVFPNTCISSIKK